MVTKNKPVCSKCGSKFTYVRIKGDIVCRACGHVTKAIKAV